MKLKMNVAATFSAALIGLAVASLGTADTWAPLTVLETATEMPSNATGNYVSDLTAGIDGQGNLVGAWSESLIPSYGAATQYQLHVSSAVFGGTWAAPLNLTYGAPTLVEGALGVASSTVGFSNALMSTTSGPVSFDHPLGGSWAPGVLIAPNEYQLPLSNRAGDQLVLGTKGTFNPRGTTPITLTATFRHGAAAWRTTETVATGNNATYEASTMGPDGTAAVVWYTFTRVCRRYCNSTNYVRHISSRAPGAAPWVDAGELPPPLNAGPATNNRLMALAADAMGHEVFLVSTTGGYGELISRSNGAWGAPVTPVADPINP